MIGKYLRQYGALAAVLVLFVGVFAAVFVLYELPAEPVWYAAGLCGLLGLAAAAIHFVRYCKRHRQRQQVLKDPAALLDGLPEAISLGEQDDRAIMNALLNELSAAQTELYRSHQDSQNYFSAWVHQIKTPLSVLRLNLQAENTPESRDMLNELFTMEQYVDMALCYTRLNDPTKDLALGQVDVDQVIRSVIREFAPLIIRKRIALHYDGCTQTALSDERWLRFLLEQVMSNAVKYTQSGSITLTVTPDPAIIVEDTGIGISPEDVPRVFEKGYTGYNGRGGQKATGLGLYLCRKTAKMLGHGITLTSEVGKGTVVTIDLRREKLEIE